MADGLLRDRGPGSTPKLRRTLGWLENFALGYADIGSTIYFCLGIVFLYAKAYAPLAFALAAIPYVLVAMVYAELASSMPEPGGAFLFSLEGLGRLAGFLAGWWLIMDYVLTASYAALSTVGYIGYYFPTLHREPFFALCGIAVLAFVIFLNILGIKESARTNLLLIAADLSGALLLGISAMLLGARSIRPLGEFDCQGFLHAVTIAMSSYIGIEVVAQASGETKNPGRDIPRAIAMISAAVISISILLSLSALRVVDPSVVAAAIKDPIPVIAEHVPKIGPFLSRYAAVMGATILLSALNSAIAGVSRLAYSMSLHGLLPRPLSRLHWRRRTPYVATLVFGAVSLALALLGSLELIAEMYVFGAFAAYALTALSLIALRNKFTSKRRPFQLPLNIRIRANNGRGVLEIPVPAVLAVLATGAVLVLSAILRRLGLIVWIAWTLVGLVVYRFSDHRRPWRQLGSA